MDTEQMKQRLTEQLQNKLNGGEEALHQSHVFTSAHAGDARRTRKPPCMGGLRHRYLCASQARMDYESKCKS